MDIVAFRRKPFVCDVLGIRPTTLHHHIKKKLVTTGIKITSDGRAVGWPETELAAIVAARTRGASDDEVRSLVDTLTRARACAA